MHSENDSGCSLRDGIKVDQHVAADDPLYMRDGRVLGQVTAAEDQQAPEVPVDAR